MEICMNFFFFLHIIQELKKHMVHVWFNFNMYNLPNVKDKIMRLQQQTRIYNKIIMNRSLIIQIYIHTHTQGQEEIQNLRTFDCLRYTLHISSLESNGGLIKYQHVISYLSLYRSVGSNCFDCLIWHLIPYFEIIIFVEPFPFLCKFIFLVIQEYQKCSFT